MDMNFAMNVERCIQIVLSSEYTLTLEALRSIFRQTAEIEVVVEAETISSVPKKVRELRPYVALMEFGGGNRAHGLRAAAEIAEQSPNTHILVLTTNSDPPFVRRM